MERRWKATRKNVSTLSFYSTVDASWRTFLQANSRSREIPESGHLLAKWSVHKTSEKFRTSYAKFLNHFPHPNCTPKSAPLVRCVLVCKKQLRALWLCGRDVAVDGLLRVSSHTFLKVATPKCIKQELWRRKMQSRSAPGRCNRCRLRQKTGEFRFCNLHWVTLNHSVAWNGFYTFSSSVVLDSWTCQCYVFARSAASVFWFLGVLTFRVWTLQLFRHKIV